MWRHSAWLVAASLAWAGTASGADLAQISKQGTLRVLTWKDNLDELFSIREGGAPGLEREVLQGFVELHGLKLQVMPVEDPVAALLAGAGDLAGGGLVATEARRRQAAFTSELFPVRHVVVTARPHAPVTTLEQLRAARVGTEKGTSWSEQARAAGVPAENLDESFASPGEVLRALKAGTISATVMSVVWAMVEKKRDPALELGLFVGPPASVGFAVRKDQPELHAALEAYVANVRRTPTWSRLVVKYFGDDGLEILKKSRQP